MSRFPSTRPGPLAAEGTGRSSRRVLAALLLVVLAPLASPALHAATTPIIGALEAARYVGEEVTVCGEVESVRRDEGSGPTLLDLDEAYPEPVFTVAVPDALRARFRPSPEAWFRGEWICVSGKVTLRHGVPSVLLEEAGRIEILPRGRRRALPPRASLPPPPAEPGCIPRSRCCKVCSEGKACGASCISRRYTCRKGRGCACNAWEICR